MASESKVSGEITIGGQLAGRDMTIGGHPTGRNITIGGQFAGRNMIIGGLPPGRDMTNGGQPAGRRSGVGFNIVVEAINAAKDLANAVKVLERAGWRTCAFAIVVAMTIMIIKATGF